MKRNGGRRVRLLFFNLSTLLFSSSYSSSLSITYSFFVAMAKRDGTEGGRRAKQVRLLLSLCSYYSPLLLILLLLGYLFSI